MHGRWSVFACQRDTVLRSRLLQLATCSLPPRSLQPCSVQLVACNCSLRRCCLQPCSCRFAHCMRPRLAHCSLAARNWPPAALDRAACSHAETAAQVERTDPAPHARNLLIFAVPRGAAAHQFTALFWWALALQTPWRRAAAFRPPAKVPDISPSGPTKINMEYRPKAS